MKFSSFHLPQYLNQRGIYYGWVVLAVGTLGIIMSVPGQTMGVSVYTDHLIVALELDRVNLSMAYMFGTIGSSFFLPLAGRFVDKSGARVMGVFSSLCLGVSLILLALSPTMVASVVSMTAWPSEWVSFGIVLLCFLGIRHFGQGQLTMASRTMMGLWYEKHRGLMLGISGAFCAMGFGIAPLALTELINHFTWSKSLLVLALGCAGMAVIALLFFRRSPEHAGLEVDGGSRTIKQPGSKQVMKTDFSLTASQAKSTFTFWVFNLGMVAQALIVTALTFHLAHIGSLVGMPAATAFSVFVPMSILSTTSELASGYLSDRFSLKYLLAVMQLGLCAGLVGLANFGSGVGYWVTAIGFGLSSGIFSLLIGAAWPKLFGRKHLGAIAGVNMSWLVFGSAIGPYMFSLGESASGNYSTVIYLSAIYPAIIFVLSKFADAPVRASFFSSSSLGPN